MNLLLEVAEFTAARRTSLLVEVIGKSNPQSLLKIALVDEYTGLAKRAYRKLEICASWATPL